jgi:hypothetical protein
MPFVPGPTSALVRVLADVLKACPIGGRATYSQLTAAIGMPVQERFYLVQRAISLANAETGAIFVNVRLVGYERLPGDAVPSVGRHARHKIRRVAIRGEKTMTNTLVRANDISNEARLKAYSEQATLGLIRYVTYDRYMATFTPGATPPPTHVQVRSTIEALRAAMRGG